MRSLGRTQGWEQVRYVIDYYGAPDDEETGMPAFILDTRPALDNPTNAYDRFTHWSKPLWKRAMGKLTICNAYIMALYILLFVDAANCVFI